MTTIATLKLTNTKKPTSASPTVLKRIKLSKRIGEQILLVRARNAGADYAVTRYRSYTDKVTGQRQQLEVRKSVRAWWFIADNDKLALQIKYGSRVIELQKGKPTVELASLDDLEATLKTIQTAVERGELDKEIAAAANQLRAGFTK